MCVCIYMYIYTFVFLILKATVCTGFDSTAESSFIISTATAVGRSSPAVPSSEDEVGGHSICHILCVCARVCVHAHKKE